MNDYTVVVNAGSSSLKFSVYRRAESDSWTLEARGQVEGIGTSPKFSAKDGADKPIGDVALDPTIRDARAALGFVANWLRDRYHGAHVCGVGHRVVHGGAQYSGPTIVTPEVLENLRALIPLAPLHQPYNLSAIEAVWERLPGVPQVVCFDTSFHRGQPAVAQAYSVTVSTVSRTSTSRRRCHRSRPRLPTGASSSLTSAAAPACVR